MSEQNNKPAQEPVPLKEAIDGLLQTGFGSYELAEDEMMRKAAAHATDALNQLQESREDREDIISRLQAGESLDPEVVAESGERLLQAQAEVQKIQQPTDIKPPETS